MTRAELAPPRRLEGMSAKQPTMRIAVVEPPQSVADRSTLRHARANDNCACVARIIRFFLWGMRNSTR
jgi:hypothetical protein